METNQSNGRRRSPGAGLIVVVMLTGLLALMPAASAIGDPALEESCGLDIALVLDVSGSIDDDELALMKGAFVSFVDAFLPGTPTEFSVTAFDTTAGVLLGFTDDKAAITAAINGADGNGFTNWEDGLTKAYGTFPGGRADKPDLVVFASDGNPNRIGAGTSATEAAAVAAAVVVADAMQAGGISIIALGIGDDLDAGNLAAVSSDVYTGGFATLAATLADLATNLCGGTITATKLIDADGDPATAGDQTPGEGWTIDITGTSVGASDPAAEVTDVDGKTAAVEVEPGTYQIDETLQTGYGFLGASCSKNVPGAVPTGVGTATSTGVEGIEVAQTDIVSCTFVNTAQGRIIVEKVAANAPQGYQFEFDTSWGPNVLLADGESADSGYLAPGTYSVSEVLSPEFVLGAAICDDGSDPSSIELGPGETVTCTFTNRMVQELCPEEPAGITPALAARLQVPGTEVPICTGEIIVVKETLPGGAEGAFQFAPSWEGNFFLADGEWHSSGQIPVGVHSVAEVGLPAGWSLGSAVCDDGSSPAAIGLSPHETVTCTFYNAQSGQIIVDKVTDPPGSAQAFEFDPSWGAGFSLADADAPVASGPLAAGVYSVAEVNLPAGWELDSAVCSDSSSPAAISLSDGETVTCTFHNSIEQVAGPNGSLTIVKRTSPAGGGGFGFTTSANLSGPFTLDDGGAMFFSELEPGAYTVTEEQPGGDWAFQSVVCEAVDWSAAGGSVTVNLTEGEAAVCTFYNIQELPYTGSSSWLLLLLAAGLGSLLLGGGLVLLPALRRKG